MHPVEQAIWLVESRLSGNPKVAELSKQTGLSRFYVARLFAETTGRTLSSYIRGRRLSEAARLLAAGAPDILSVALGSGYASHEAFTRAFRDQFGTTPEQIRKSRDLTTIELVEPIRMNASQRVPLKAPRIETLPAMSLVGITRVYSMSELGAIPDQWAQFMPYLAGLDPRRIEGAYGVCGNAAANGENVEYTCAVRSGGGLEPGGDLVRIDLPAMRVAKYAHQGHISGIKATTGAVFEQMASDGIRSAGPVDLIEFYGPAFDPATGFGTVELWMHIEK